MRLWNSLSESDNTRKRERERERERARVLIDWLTIEQVSKQVLVGGAKSLISSPACAHASSLFLDHASSSKCLDQPKQVVMTWLILRTNHYQM